MSEFYTKPREITEAYALCAGAVAVELWFKIDDEDEVLDMRITPDNTVIYLNDSSPNLDSYSIIDARDNTSWVRFREEAGDDSFTSAIDRMHEHALVKATPDPDPMMIDIYINRNIKDLSKADTMPREWNIKTDDRDS